MPKARIRITSAKFNGEIMVDGQRAYFEAHVLGPRVDAEFRQHPVSEKAIDQWALFRALETFIDENLRG